MSVHKTEAEFVAAREARDRTLAMPKLILHALQVNTNAGRLPEPETNGRRYIKIPLNLLEGAAYAGLLSRPCSGFLLGGDGRRPRDRFFSHCAECRRFANNSHRGHPARRAGVLLSPSMYVTVRHACVI